MIHRWKSMAMVLVAVVLVAGYADQTSAQRNRGGVNPTGHVVRSFLPQNTRTTANPATVTDKGTANQSRTQRSIGVTPGGLTFGGSKSSLAISLAPGAVGVAVGTDSTAVAVAVAGGEVGVGWSFARLINEVRQGAVAASEDTRADTWQLFCLAMR